MCSKCADLTHNDDIENNQTEIKILRRHRRLIIKGGKDD